MIAVEVLVLCESCGARYPHHGGTLLYVANFGELISAAGGRVHAAKLDGWTEDGQAHWCPECTVTRFAAPRKNVHLAPAANNRPE